MKNEQLRRGLEKIAWKNYDPEVSINVEEMLDEMMPVIEEALSQQREEMAKEVMAIISKSKATFFVTDEKVEIPVEEQMYELKASISNDVGMYFSKLLSNPLNK